jgi:hypothetical protein
VARTESLAAFPVKEYGRRIGKVTREEHTPGVQRTVKQMDERKRVAVPRRSGE